MKNKQTAVMQLSALNIVPTARIKIINDGGFTTSDGVHHPVVYGQNGFPKYLTVGVCDYTPKHINDVLKREGIESAWVFWEDVREYWTVGDRLAEKFTG